MVVEYRAQGFLPSQRHVEVKWQSWAPCRTSLIPSAATSDALAGPWSRAAASGDADGQSGTRRLQARHDGGDGAAGRGSCCSRRLRCARRSSRSDRTARKRAGLPLMTGYTYAVGSRSTGARGRRAASSSVSPCRSTSTTSWASGGDGAARLLRLRGDAGLGAGRPRDRHRRRGGRLALVDPTATVTWTTSCPGGARYRCAERARLADLYDAEHRSGGRRSRISRRGSELAVWAAARRAPPNMPLPPDEDTVDGTCGRAARSSTATTAPSANGSRSRGRRTR